MSVPNSKTKPIYTLVGSTGTGKTQLSFAMARKLDAVIISADALLFYRHVNIGSAKPRPEELAMFPHHMIDIIDPDENYNVSQYCEQTLRLMRDYHIQGRRVLIVGAAGMYLKRLTSGVFQGPGRDDRIRERLFRELNELGEERLYTRLCQIDPVAAGKIHPHNHRRLIRALEVYEMSGQPLSWWHEKHTQQPQEFSFRFIGLERAQDELERRVAKRTQDMMSAGLLDEVAWLNETYTLAPTIRHAIGYREVLAHLHGQCTYDDMVHDISLHTRQLIKKQRTWFRRHAAIKWFFCHGDVMDMFPQIAQWMDDNDV